MSARVNLLPEETRRRAGAARMQGLLVFLALVLVAALVGLHYLNRADLEDARERLEVAENEQRIAEEDVAALSSFAELTDRLEETRTVVAETLGQQVTLAGILQDLALVMPADADVSAVSISLESLDADAPASAPVGSMSMSGESVGDIAPGIERLILELDKVAGFRNVHVSSASVDDEDVVAYTLELQLGPENRTNRYRDGVPGTLR